MLKPKQSFEPIEAVFLKGIVSNAILESVRMGLFDALEKPSTIQELSMSFGIPDSSMGSLLCLLETTGTIVRNDTIFKNSELASEFLVTTSPYYQGQILEHYHEGCNSFVRKMPSLLRKPGRPGDHTHDEHSSADSLRGVLQYAMRGLLQDTTEFVASLPGFAEICTMCDVGGNHGGYAMALLDRNPQMRAVILDLPSVAPAIEEFCRQADYGERLSVLPADLRTDELPRNAYDLVLVSHVLQMFRDEFGETIAKIGTSIKPGGWFVSNHMNPEGGADSKFVATINLAACLVAGVNHLISRDDLASALSRAGFGDFVTERIGPNDLNMIFAARKKAVS